jgi:HlyD family secretion protein
MKKIMRLRRQLDKPEIGKRRLKNLLFAAPIGIFFIFTPGCGSKSHDNQQTPPKPKVLSIQRIIGIGRIEPEMKIVGLAGEVPGIVERINIQAGDSVHQGQVIVEMKHEIEQAKVEQAQARLNARQSAIESAKAALAEAQIRMENSRVNWNRIKALYENGAENRAAYENLTAQYQAALEIVKQLDAGLKASKNDLKEAQADLHAAEAEKRQKFITAPADGQLLSLDITVGSVISAGKPIGDFALKSPLTAWCEIDELFAGNIKKGQKAYIRTEGVDDTLATGEVTFAGPYLRKKSIFSDDVGALEDRRIREVRILLNPNNTLLSGQRVECVVLTEHTWER